MFGGGEAGGTIDLLPFCLRPSSIAVNVPGQLLEQQISYELGFPTQSFFGKFFKRVTGMSPREYREG